MALTTRQELKQEILDNIGQFTGNPYAEDLLHEFADSVTPIYDFDVIGEWVTLPNEYCDTWQDTGITGGIAKLMQVDLYNYYWQQLHDVWLEIKEELEEGEE